MNKDEFMRQVEYLLSDIPEEETADAVAYYRDYLEEAGDTAGEVLREFGSPERIAAIIRSDLRGDLEDGGAFTERGYEDERFKDPGYQVVERKDLPETVSFDGAGAKGKDDAGGGKETGEKKNGISDWFLRIPKGFRYGLLAVVLLAAAPVLLGIGGGILGIVTGILGLFLALILSLGLLTFGRCSRRRRLWWKRRPPACMRLRRQWVREAQALWKPSRLRRRGSGIGN